MLEQVPPQMGEGVVRWAKLVIPLVVHSASKVRLRAAAAMEMGMPLLLEKQMDVAAVIEPIMSPVSICVHVVWFGGFLYTGNDCCTKGDLKSVDLHEDIQIFKVNYFLALIIVILSSAELFVLTETDPRAAEAFHVQE